LTEHPVMSSASDVKQKFASIASRRVKTQDVSNLLGALDRAIPGLGKVVKQNVNVGVAAGINALGKEAVLEGKKARSFPLRFADGTVYLGPIKVGQIPPLF
jgi:hypothetical protein